MSDTALSETKKVMFEAGTKFGDLPQVVECVGSAEFRYPSVRVLKEFGETMLATVSPRKRENFEGLLRSLCRCVTEVQLKLARAAAAPEGGPEREEELESARNELECAASEGSYIADNYLS